MRKKFGRRARLGRETRAVFLAIGAGLLLGMPAGAVRSVRATEVRAAARDGGAETFAANLTIDPSRWWTEGGTPTPVSAVWTGLSPGCSAQPEWFRWSIGPGGAEGAVVPTNRSTVNFTAFGIESGTTRLEVAAAALVACPSDDRSVFGTANATIEVDAPLAILGLRTVAWASATNATARVAGTLVGGEPPYSLIIDWGTGNVTTATVEGPGNFSVGGTPGIGPLDPTVLATDAAGLVARASVEENESADGSLAVAIVPSTYTAEVGVAVDFRIVSTFLPGSYSTVTVCEMIGVARAATEVESSDGFSCAFASPGLANITVLAVGNDPPFPTASAQLHEPVVPPLRLAPGELDAPAEVGRVTYVPINLTGGAPPYRLHWRFVGSEVTGNATVPRDGTYLAPVVPGGAGTEALAVSATDALGLPAANVSAPVVVEGALAVGATASGASNPNGTALAVSGSITVGAAPFDWSVLALTLRGSDSSAGGIASAPGPFGWTGVDPAEGVVPLSFVVVDAAGAVWTGGLSVEAVPTLSVALVAAAGGPGRWTGTLEITGGVPPFSVGIVGPDGPEWNRSGVSARNWSVTVAGLPAGALSLTIEAVDRLGVSAHAVAALTIAPGTNNLPPTSPGLVPGVALVVVAGAAIVLWRWRRRPFAPSVPVGDPVATLRTILAPADGADRGVVELLAEEQGIPLPVVRTTIDRLIAEGTIRAESGADGEEVLAWRDRP